MPHRQDAEQEAAVERVGVLLEGELQVVDAAVDLGQRSSLAVVGGHLGPNLDQGGELLAARGVDPEAGQLVSKVVVAGERRGEDDPGAVAQVVGKHPPVGQLAADARRPIVLDERDAGVAQGVDPGADGELGLSSERRDPVGVDAELVAEVELAGPAGQLDDVGRAIDRLEAPATFALDQPGDVLVEHLLANSRRDHVDPLLTVQDAGDVGVVEDVCRAGQAEGRTRDHDRLGRRRGIVDPVRPGGSGRGIGELESQRIGRVDAETRGVETAESLVEGSRITELGVVGRQRHHVVAEDVGGETLEGLLRADLNEHASALLVQRAQTLNELDRRRHLGGEQVKHLGDDVWPRRVEAAGHVRHDRDLRRPQLEPLQRAPQRLAGGSHDRCVEGVADREHGGLEFALLELLDGRFDSFRRPTDDRLGRRVDIGDDDVAVGFSNDPLDLGERGEDRRHRAVVARC